MTNQETLEKMRKMKFLGMYRSFKTCIESGNTDQMTTDEIVSMLIETEWDDRQNRNIERHIHNARFRYKASVEEMSYEANRNLDKNQLLRYAECVFIKNHENIIITGSTGVGKSYISSAIGHQACCIGYKVMYFNSSKLFSKLKMAKADGTYTKEISKIEKQDLFIIDDFGIQPLDVQSRMVFMEIIEDRHGKGSMIITSQVPVKQWYEVIGEKTIADAILDRIIHNAHKIELKGESLRKKIADKNSN